MNVTGTVTEIKIDPDGQNTGRVAMLNQNMTQRHGHDAFKVGDEVSIWVNENNTGGHTSIKKARTACVGSSQGKLIFVGKMKKEIKLWTPEGEKMFPLDRLEVKTGGLSEGTLVTVELNESGTVIDLHAAEFGH